MRGVVRGPGDEADVEVVHLDPRLAEQDRVLVEVRRHRVEVQGGQSGLLQRLPQRDAGQGGVAGLAVTAEGEPPTRLAVQVEQDVLTARVDHEGPGGEVVGNAVAPGALGLGVQVLDVPRAQGLLRRRG